MANPDFSISDVLEWARTKPAGGGYRYGDVGNCALCQFLRETGRAMQPGAGGTFWEDDAVPGSHYQIEAGLRTALIGNTFGDLVSKLEALAPETVVTPSNWLTIDAYLTDRVEA